MHALSSFKMSRSALLFLIILIVHIVLYYLVCFHSHCFRYFLPDSHWWQTGMIYFLMQHSLYSIVIFCHSNTLLPSSSSSSLSQPQVKFREVFWNFLWSARQNFIWDTILHILNSKKISSGPQCFSSNCHPSTLTGKWMDSASWCQQIEFKNIYICHLACHLW